MLLNEYKKIIVFDTETTGVDFDNSRIIELAYNIYECVGYGKFNKLKSVDVFVKHDNINIEELETERLNSEGNKMTISELTHITQSMLDDEGISEQEMCDLINQDFFCESINLISGYNVNFDLNMLIGALKRNNSFNEDKFINQDYLDLMTVYKDNYKWDNTLDETGKMLGHRLDACVKNLAIEVKNTHRAIDDVNATFEILPILITKKVKVLPYINNFGYNAKYDIECVPKIRYHAQSKTMSCYYSILKNQKHI